MENDNKKKKKFSLFRYSLDGKGVSKDENEERNFTFFFKLLGRKLSSILSVNILLLLGNFPIFFLILGMSSNFNDVSYAPPSQYFGPVYGALKLSGGASAAEAAIRGVHGLQIEISVNTTATNIMFILGALVTLTFGVTVAATTYIMRNLVKGEPVFLLQDFVRTIKNNWKQALPFGIFDVVVSLIIVYDLYFFAANRGTYVANVMFFLALAIGLIYFVMRFYIYTMMVTFRLSIYKLLKNAFIFSVVGFKRNILGLLGIAVVILFNYALLFVFFPLGMLLPFVVTTSLCQFIAIYTSWPKIYEIMIEPYEEDDDTPKEEPIFRDDVQKKPKRRAKAE